MSKGFSVFWSNEDQIAEGSLKQPIRAVSFTDLGTKS